MPVEPPVAERVPHVETRHGERVRDDYFWLRDRSNPEVERYLKAENEYTRRLMQPTEPLQDRLYREMLARIKQTDLSVPEREGDYRYYHRTEEGRQYRIHCRRKGSLEAAEEVILDENELAQGERYFRLGGLEVSPDHRLLAFSVDTTGGERYTLYIKDLGTGRVLEDGIPNTYSFEWANDSRTVFYSTLDEAHRPYRLHRHLLGAPASRDVLVYQEDDDAFFLDIDRTRSRRYLLLQLGSNTTTEIRYLDADDPTGSFRPIQPRRHRLEYAVEHWGARFFILNNDGAVNFRLVEAPVADPSMENWKEVIPHRDDVLLESIEAFAGHLALVQRRNGLREVRVIDLPARTEHTIEFPEPAYSLRLGRNPEFDTRLLRFTYESPVTPESVFDYDMTTRERTLLKEQEVLGGYDRTAYEVERLFATAPDGARVPITLAHKKGLKRDGTNPLLLYGYGSYGAVVDPTFSSNRLSLLDRGLVYAIAHVRGGGAFGRPWYEDGKMLRKRNTFTDFIACAEHLIARGYSSERRLAIHGGSAGGLLVGAVINMRPDLFKVVVADVPFVDVVNTMLDASIPLTAIEWEEWGDPREKEYYDYMRSYSPYDNVGAKDYPDLLITTSLNDPRVSYWEPAKWAAKLRALKTGDGLLLLKTNMDAGHGGASGRYERLKELAFEYAFLLSRLGVER
ncbi:MAG: S9 family peptidase [Acidobacteriota bacterium]